VFGTGAEAILASKEFFVQKNLQPTFRVAKADYGRLLLRKLLEL